MRGIKKENLWRKLRDQKRQVATRTELKRGPVPISSKKRTTKKTRQNSKKDRHWEKEVANTWLRMIKELKTETDNHFPSP